MAVDLDQLRAAAQRVAASHGLDVVEVDFAGGGKFRSLRVFVEKNAEGRAALAEAAKAAQAAFEAGASRTRGEQEMRRSLGEQAAVSEAVAEEAVAEDEDAGEEEAGLEEGAIPRAVLEGTLSIEHLSGVTHEDCEQFSRDFGMFLDVEDLVPGTEYTLEVSSPGLDRKLTAAEDYQRFRGSLMKLQTFAAVAGNRHWKGRIERFEDGKLTLDTGGTKQKAAKGKGAKKKEPVPAAAAVEIEFANIEKANLVPEF